MKRTETVTVRLEISESDMIDFISTGVHLEDPPPPDARVHFRGDEDGVRSVVYEWTRDVCPEDDVGDAEQRS